VNREKTFASRLALGIIGGSLKHLTNTKMNKKGFTLIELLIVVTIIGILAVALVPKIVGGSAGARDSRRMTDVATIVNGLEYYVLEAGDFVNLGGVDDNAGGELICASLDALATDLGGFIKSMPSDPLDGNANAAFGGNCAGSYTIMLMTDAAGGLTRYAVAAALEDPGVGDEGVYAEEEDVTVAYGDFEPAAYAADEGSYIAY